VSFFNESSKSKGVPEVSAKIAILVNFYNYVNLSKLWETTKIIIYDIFVNQPTCSNNPWQVASYFTSESQLNNESQTVTILHQPCQWTAQK